jgi:hypothetical protein
VAKKYEKPVLIHITGKEDLLCVGYICSTGASPQGHGACKTGNIPTGTCNTGNGRKENRDFTSKLDSVISCNEGLQLNDYLYIEEIIEKKRILFESSWDIAPKVPCYNLGVSVSGTFWKNF